MLKSIFTTYGDDDQIRVTFDMTAEQSAFDAAIALMNERVAKNGKEREQMIGDFKFETSLQVAVVREHADDFKAITGLAVMNFYSLKREVPLTVVPMPALPKASPVAE
mgnify:CR=1 FL=1